MGFWGFGVLGLEKLSNSDDGVVVIFVEMASRLLQKSPRLTVRNAIGGGWQGLGSGFEGGREILMYPPPTYAASYRKLQKCTKGEHLQKNWNRGFIVLPLYSLLY